MEQYYSNDSFTAFKTDSGVLIEERKKGSLKMLLVLGGVCLLMVIGGFLIGLFGGTIGFAMAPFLIWGGAIVLVICVIALLLKLVIQTDPKIVFDTNDKTLSMRGKVFQFDQISEIESTLQPMLGKTMVVAFIHINGKKKSLFSTAIAVKDPQDVQAFIGDLNTLIQGE